MLALQDTNESEPQDILVGSETYLDKEHFHSARDLLREEDCCRQAGICSGPETHVGLQPLVEVCWKQQRFPSFNEGATGGGMLSVGMVRTDVGGQRRAVDIMTVSRWATRRGSRQARRCGHH